MLIRSTYNGGFADVSESEAALYISTGHWVAPDDYVAAEPAETPTPAPAKRKRRTKAEMEAARAAEAAKNQE
ncbi:hypothetical protein SEA_YECEY3_17 [Mycobacterium phage Yecey3]|uniref:Head-to-tail connector protein n=1 Tax=Mycobacterium phage Yecey3 TaxID=2656617 RepID=A0A649V9E4_9CAUD|nr:hypothetical protein KIV58_gp092 [Mycobacterium phage Yecey3]QGJ88769.1 hypothetical protein SEA_YECEY3_17 [Mycobacterium phage Yecey3]